MSILDPIPQPLMLRTCLPFYSIGLEGKFVSKMPIGGGGFLSVASHMSSKPSKHEKGNRDGRHGVTKVCRGPTELCLHAFGNKRAADHAETPTGG